MARILQGNLHRSRLAHDLLPQFVAEEKADILLISEQYTDRDTPGWVSNDARTAAVWVPRRGIAESGTGDDYVRVRVGRITYFSVYLSPNLTAADFAIRLGVLEDAIRDVSGELVIGGDFNVRATEWGMTTTNCRCRAILEMAALLSLVVANEGNTTTYRRPGFGESIPDVTFASETTIRKIRDWHVMEEYTASDHQYILFDIQDDHRNRTRERKKQTPRWNTRRMNRNRLAEEMQRAELPSIGLPQHLSGR
ncbi:uncharacterized protein LOC116415934 [Nasonia vitripennis]|uniref:Endonuclease/exonuclease/phosphatase domain-containing protein n=1 Tax=Nasonia vitripennis TaxID=7425 RepID=A0A7M7PX69_NASVI|nr:uncharacterized protein LOC116415934 [Nasonia vitripennis]